MTTYLPDREDTIARLYGFQQQAIFAQQELAAAVLVARRLGLSWTEVGQALGTTKQGASQWAKRNTVGTDGTELEPEVAEQMAKLLGAREKADRYVVRLITAGKEGVTAVTRQDLSTHLKLRVAVERAMKREGAEVWRRGPDGTQVLLYRHHHLADALDKMTTVAEAQRCSCGTCAGCTF